MLPICRTLECQMCFVCPEKTEYAVSTYRQQVSLFAQRVLQQDILHDRLESCDFDVCADCLASSVVAGQA